MVVGRKHEADAHLRNALGNLLRREVDVDTQALQHIGAAALAADTAAPVLAHFCTASCGHKHRASRNIERVRAIAAGAHDVHQMRGICHLHLGGKLSHHLCGCGDLANRFLLHAQRGDEGRHHGLRHLTAHDEAHDVQHLVVKNLAVLDDALQSFLRCDVVNGCGHGRSLFGVKKVFQHGVTMLGQDGFGMKLHTLNIQLSVTHAHDFTIVSPRGDLQTRRTRRALNR